MAWIVLADGAVDTDLGLVRRGGSEEPLTQKEAEVLALLISEGGRSVSRETIHAQVFGYRAGTRTRAADDTVKRLRKKLEVSPAKPQHILTVRGTGYRFASMASDADVVPGVVGRTADVQALLRLLDATSSVAVTGLGGIGKSTVARAVVHLWRGPAWTVSVSGCRALSDLVAAVAAALGQQVTARATPTAALALGHAAAREGGALLMFDEADACVGPLSDLLSLWMEAVPGLRVLVTSRLAPSLAGLHVYRLGPLSVESSVALLVRRGASSRDPEALRTLAAELDGHPLALARAAAGEEQPTDGIGWAVEQLDGSSLHVAAAVARFVGGATLEHLSELCPSGLLQGLRRLAGLSLVQLRDGRYHTPQAVREALRGAVAELAAPYVALLVEVGETLSQEVGNDPDPERWRQLRVLYPDLVAATVLALKQDPRAAVRLALVSAVLDQQLLPGEAQLERWERVMAVVPTGDATLDDTARLYSANAQSLWGGRRAPVSLRLEVADRARARGDAALELTALEPMAWGVVPGVDLLQRAERLADGADSPVVRARAGALAAAVLRTRGEVRAAVVRWRQAIACLPEGHLSLRVIRMHFGLVLVSVGEGAAAESVLATAEESAAQTGLSFSVQVLRSARAWAIAQHDLARALELFETVDLSAVSPRSSLAVRHALWWAGTRVASGQAAQVPDGCESTRSPRLACGAVGLVALAEGRGRARQWLDAAAERVRGALADEWVAVTRALLEGTPAPEMAHEDPLLTALAQLASADAHERRTGERWARRHIWARVWSRVLHSTTAGD